MINPDQVPYLEQVSLNEATRIPESILQDLGEVELSSYFDQLLRGLALNLRVKITAQKLEPQELYETVYHDVVIPKTWWDHFKSDYSQKWWFKWFVKHRPPNMKHHVFQKTLKLYAEPILLFPDIQIPPQFGRSYRHVKMRSELRDGGP